MQNQSLLRYICTCFLQKGYGAYKPHQTGVAHYVLSHHGEDDAFLPEVVYEHAKEFVLLTMI